MRNYRNTYWMAGRGRLWLGAAGVFALLLVAVLVATPTLQAASNSKPTISEIGDQEIDEDTILGPITFTVADAETPAADLAIYLQSGNEELVPPAGLVLGGSGSSRTLTVIPYPGRWGTALITIIVSNNSDTATASFLLTVHAVDDPPTISSIADQALEAGRPSPPIAVTVGDVDTDPELLTLNAVAADPDLLPLESFAYGGSGISRTLTITPPVGVAGTTVVTLTVSDAATSTPTAFTVTVITPNQPPFLSPIVDQTTDEDVPLSVAFLATDVETSSDQLNYLALSSNQTLLPNANLVLGGSGNNRTLTLTPALNRSGEAEITISAADGEYITSRTFRVTVRAVNDTPTIEDIPSQTINEDTVLNLAVVVADVDTARENLAVTATSTNADLAPNQNITVTRTGDKIVLQVKPAANQSGSAAILVTVSDGASFVTDSFLLTVLPVNDLPQVVPFGNQSTMEEQPFGPFSFFVQDVESPASTLVVTATSSNTSVVSNTNILLGGDAMTRTMTITPTSNAYGTTNITIYVSDGVGTGTFQFRFTVEGVNDSPTISDINDVTTPEDTAVTTTFVASDPETPATQLKYRIASSNPSLIPPGNALFSSTNSSVRLTLRPAANLSGSAVITVTVSDGALEASTAFSLTVTPVNDPPVLSPIANLITPENTAATATFTVSDVDHDVDALSWRFTSSNPALVPEGNISMAGAAGNRTLTITPAPGGYGVSEITIQASDGVDMTAVTFKLTVRARPTISAIDTQHTLEDVPHSLNFTIADGDTDSNRLTLSVDSSNTVLLPKNRLTLGGAGSERTLTMSPVANGWGSSQITITVSDGNLTASTSFRLDVAAVDDPPVIAAIAGHAMDQDSQLTVVFRVSDVDTAVEQITVSAGAADQILFPAGTMQISGSGAERTLVLTPAAGKAGTTEITLTASDGAGQSSQSFSLWVNAAPTIDVAANVTTPEDTVQTVMFTVADADNAPETLTVKASSANPQLLPNSGLTLAKNGALWALSMTPAPNQTGTATVTLTASDGRLVTERAFGVTVTPVNDAPVVSAIASQTIDEDTVSGPVPFTIDDIDTPVSELALYGSSSNLALVPHTNIVFGGEGNERTVSVTPLPNVSGSLQISVTVHDGNLSTTSVYTLTIEPINDAPVLAPIPAHETLEDVAVVVTVTIDDIDSAVETLTLSGQSSNPALVSAAGMTFSVSGKERLLTILPEPDQSGEAALTVVVSDGSLTSSQTFTLTVHNTNDGPWLEPVADQTMAEDTTLEVSLRLHDIDTAPELLTLTATSSEIHLLPPAQITIDGHGLERTLVLTPTHNRHGAARINLVLDDGEVTFSHSFLVTVRPVNDPPNAEDDVYTIITTAETNLGVLANDGDVDRDTIALASVSQPSVGQVSINRDNTIRYRIPPGFIGQDVFSYTIRDGLGLEDSAQVTINVIEPAGLNTPAIGEIEPAQGVNDRRVRITIRGINFRPGISVHLGAYPLSDVELIDSETLQATVPAFLPPDRYDIIVKNRDGHTAVRSGAYLVDTDKIALIQVRPGQGRVDLPVHLNVYGLNFDAGASVYVGETRLATKMVKSSHLQALAPADSIAPGRYAVTVVNENGQEYTVADAYTAYATGSDDLFAYPYELWTLPASLHIGQSVQLGLHVRRQGGVAELLDIEVDFYINTPYDEDALVGRAIVPALLPGDDANSEAVTWTPPAAGNYTLYAVLDPRNRVPENDEANNLIKQTVTVLPTTVDMAAPLIETLAVNDGAPVVQSTAISVTVGAADAESQVRAVYLVEYEYIHGAGQWVPVQWSDWLDYGETPTSYAWTLQSSPGIKYIQVWAADVHGNITSVPALAAINYFPPGEDHVAAEQVRLYRFALASGDWFSAFLVSSQGDPDLYVWPPDFYTRPPWIANLRNGVDEVGFVAPVTGVYQLEISGHSDATYRSSVELRRRAQRSTEPDLGKHVDPDKERLDKPYMPILDMPAVEYWLPSSPPPLPPQARHRLFAPALYSSGQRNSLGPGAAAANEQHVYLPEVTQ